MYNVLLVDDELLSLKAVTDYVDWNSMGIKVIGTAKNGKDALKKSIELRPDLIITDVKMPIMDGIEFAVQLRNIDKKVKLIFLTGYDDFSYAKSAIQLQASNYILKPFSISELCDTVMKVKKELELESISDSSRKIYIEDRFRQLLNSNIYTEEINIIINELSNAFGTDVENSKYNVLIINAKFPHHDTSALICALDDNIIFVKDLDWYIIILDSSVVSKKFNTIHELAAKIHITLVDNKKASNILVFPDTFVLSELYTIHLKISSSSDLLFYSTINSLVTYSETDVSPSDKIAPNFEINITDALFSYNNQIALNSVNEFFSKLLSIKPSKDKFLNIVFDLYSNVWDEFSKNNTDINKITLTKNDFLLKMNNCSSFEEVSELTIEQITNISLYLVSKQKDKNQYIVDKVIKFIEANYKLQITLNDVANEVYLSPNYLRNIFKEKTGVTFLDYLTNFRMKKATDLLKNKSLKVHEISNLVSYENVSYFCSVFTKYYGVSPNEYRNKY